ncbi:MAG TPA: DivIVA domain-containing protein [Acidimicrobiales bacterium]|nr:DivIVA domain-containing protein [Acidimicrobiales bacterium]
MTISSSSHLAPDEVARHTFATIRRGFDPEEVRAYLESLAKGLRELAEREHEFRREIEDAERRAASPVINEETLTAALGQETARVLHSAHEASNEMVGKAQAEADRLLNDAREEIAATEARVSAQLSDRTQEAEVVAADFRQRAQEEAGATTAAARAEVEAMITQARSDCREMIDEAQGLRARVLADLSKRRKVLHAQIEQLRAGREHLADTVRGVRRSIDTIADDLFRAEDEARLAAEAAGRAAVARPDEGTPEELATALLAEEAAHAEVADVGPDEGAGSPDLTLPDPVLVETVIELEETVVELDEVEVSVPEDDDRPEPLPSVDALFAKIRAQREDTGAALDAPPGPVGQPSVEEPAIEMTDPTAPTAVVDSSAIAVDVPGAGEESDEGEEPAPPEDRNPFVIRRDEMTAPLVKALARRMKRTLQDDQNDILDRLRSDHFRWSAAVLPADPEHLDSYSTAALPHLVQAGQAGASFAGSEGSHRPLTDDMAKVARELAEAIIGPLRRRLTDGADEDLQGADESVVAEHVGSAFREWKGERIERLVGDYVVAAFSIGSLAGTQRKKSLQIEWIAATETGEEPCPDCEDNMLNGPQRPGGEFPTGHVHPPAHPGCRCLLAPSAT